MACNNISLMQCAMASSGFGVPADHSTYLPGLAHLMRPRTSVSRVPVMGISIFTGPVTCAK